MKIVLILLQVKRDGLVLDGPRAKPKSFIVFLLNGINSCRMFQLRFMFRVGKGFWCPGHCRLSFSASLWPESETRSAIFGRQNPSSPNNSEPGHRVSPRTGSVLANAQALFHYACAERPPNGSAHKTARCQGCCTSVWGYAVRLSPSLCDDHDVVPLRPVHLDPRHVNRLFVIYVIMITIGFMIKMRYFGSNGTPASCGRKSSKKMRSWH